MPRAHDRLRRAARAPGRLPGRALRRGLLACPRRRSRASGREFASTQPSLLRLGVGAQRHMGAPIAYRTIACLPALAGSWRHEGGGCSYIPTATAGAIDADELAPRRPAPGAGAAHQHVPARARADRPGARRRRSRRWSCWNANPAAIAPDQDRVLEGLRREDLFTVVLEQFMTDTARYADVVLPATTQLEHLDAVVLLGPSLRHLQRAGDRAAAARRSPTPRSSGCSPRGMGLDDPCFRETDEEMLASLFADAPAGVTLADAARARLGEDRPRPGPRPARRGRLRHARRQARAARRLARRAGHRRAAVLRPARRGRRRGAGAALPARADHAEDAPVPELHLRQPAPPARRPARAVRRHPPGRRRRARDRGRRASSASGTTAAPSRRAPASPTTPGRRCSSRPMGWWNARLPGRAVPRRRRRPRS